MQNQASTTVRAWLTETFGPAHRSHVTVTVEQLNGLMAEWLKLESLRDPLLAFANELAYWGVNRLRIEAEGRHVDLVRWTMVTAEQFAAEIREAIRKLAQASAG